MGRDIRPQKISNSHNLEDFDCGNKELNDWLRKKALKSEGRSARTYVLCHENNKVIAYYAICAAVISRDHAVGQMKRNVPKEVPVLKLGRMAIDKAYQGIGLGRKIVQDVCNRTLAQAQDTGIAGLIVDAVDDNAKYFYENLGFEPSEYDPKLLMINCPKIMAGYQSLRVAKKTFDDMKTVEYPVDEFLKDIREVNQQIKSQERRRGSKFEPTELIPVIGDYVTEKYGEIAHALTFVMMIFTTRSYIFAVLKELDEKDYAVIGSKKVGALVSAKVVMAVHEVMISKPAKEWPEHFKPDNIKKIADEIAAKIGGE